jgi:5'-3' exonuclease
MYDLISHLRKYKIIPIGVFDNKIPNIKLGEVKKRESTRNVRKNKIETMVIDIKKNNPTLLKSDKLTDQVKEIKDLTLDITKVCKLDDSTWNKVKDVKKLCKNSVNVTQLDYRCCQALFRYLGIPYVVSEYEADDMCGYLYKKGLVDGCISEDTDMLVHGIGLILRNYNTFSETVDAYYLDNICNDLDLTKSQFIDTCILMGTDYYKIYGIGPKTAYKLIKNHKSIDNDDLNKILKEKYKVDFNKFDYKLLRSVFNRYMTDTKYDERIKQMPDGLELSPNVRIEKLIKFIEKTCEITLDPDDINKCLNK